MPAYYRVKRAEGSRERREQAINFLQHGPQNTRGFRALKVWLALRHVGRDGYIRMMSENVRLAALVYERAGEHPELEALAHNLSIANFRYVPPDLQGREEESADYLNLLNSEIGNRVRASGEAFISPGQVRGLATLRVALVNFRTTEEDIETLIDLTVRAGRDLHTAKAGEGAVPTKPAAATGPPDIGSRLAETAVFREVPPEGIGFLAERSTLTNHPQGTELMREDERSDSMHIVMKGHVRVEQSRPDEKPLHLADLGPGEVVGEMGVLDGEPRSATVVAIDDTVTIEIGADAVREALREFPQVAAGMLPTLSRRIRKTQELASSTSR